MSQHPSGPDHNKPIIDLFPNSAKSVKPDLQYGRFDRHRVCIGLILKEHTICRSFIY